MLMKKINKNLPSKVAKSGICAFLGLFMLSIIVFRQSEMTDFIIVLFKIYIFFLLIYWLCLLVLGELIANVRNIKLIFRSNLTLALLSILFVLLVVEPLHRFVYDDVLLTLGIIITFLLSINIYVRLR